MRIFPLMMVLLAFGLEAQAQHKITYQSYVKGSSDGDTTLIEVIQNAETLKISSLMETIQHPIPGYSTAVTYIDYSVDSAYYQVNFSDQESCYTVYSTENKDLDFTMEGEETILGYACKKYKTSINSNTIEIWVTEKLPYRATPFSNMASLPGVMVRCMRNGSYTTDLGSIEKDKSLTRLSIPQNMGERKSGAEISRLKKDKLVLRKTIFSDEQINFEDIKPFSGVMPLDSTIRFSSGTVIVKRIHLDTLPKHYLLFAELKQQSNGDAYDRTASVFVIPTERAKSLLDGMENGLEALPLLKGKDGQEYQGVTLQDDYLPAIELVRFFTPFGVNHFNEKVKIEGLEWADEAYYKQDVTDLSDRLSGDVLIGAFIGNYDKGGHKLSLDLVAYPNDYEWIVEDSDQVSLPLFNTCNVLEMSGQNYGRLFGTDSLTVSFELPEGASNVRLRYISTGHGGWGGGDEFNPKENVIIIDGEKCFVYTPWRCDCATYRELNPVSGNFWNGVSSSDYSRSGWCPGTATQPTYFNLDFLSAGKHTMTVAIPQGKEEGESFSHWMISGVLLFNK